MKKKKKHLNLWMNHMKIEWNTHIYLEKKKTDKNKMASVYRAKAKKLFKSQKTQFSFLSFFLYMYVYIYPEWQA